MIGVFYTIKICLEYFEAFVVGKNSKRISASCFFFLFRVLFLVVFFLVSSLSSRPCFRFFALFNLPSFQFLERPNSFLVTDSFNRIILYHPQFLFLNNNMNSCLYITTSLLVYINIENKEIFNLYRSLFYSKIETLLFSRKSKD